MSALREALRRLVRSRALPTQFLALGSLMVIYFLVRLLTPEHPNLDAAPVDALGGSALPTPSDLMDSTAALGFLLLGAFISGNISRAAGLPRLTGHLIFGCIAGPQLPAALGLPQWTLITTGQLNHLGIVNALAVSLIGLNAGGAIRLSFIRRHGRGLLLFVSITTSAVALFCGAAGWWVFPSMLGSESTLSGSQTLAVAALIGIICATTSPAACIALMRETGARGVMAHAALTATVCGDLICSIALSAVIAFTAGTLDPNFALRSGDMGVVWHLVGSFAVGAIAAPILQILGSKASARPQTAVLVGALGLALVCTSLSLSPLVAALSAGLVQANVLPGSSRRFFEGIDSLSAPVFCVFFAIAGAGIDVNMLKVLWPAALGLVALRAVTSTFFTAATVRFVGLPPPARRWLWTALLPQAGVSLALANEVHSSFPDSSWSLALWSLLVTVIAINETLGPPLMRYGLIRAGEASWSK